MIKRQSLRLLLVLLLTGQGLLLLHASQHVDADASHCAVCVQAQAFRTEPPAFVPAPFFTRALGGPVVAKVVSYRTRRPASVSARAPPFSTPLAINPV